MSEPSETPFIVKWCDGPGRRVISALVRSETVDLNPEDILQEVATRWWQHAGRYDEKPEVERLAIANQIARNLVYECIRNSRHRVELPPSDVLTDPAPTALEVACEIEDNASKVRELLAEVGGDDAEVARLRFLEGLDAATIASIRGIAPHSVHTILSRFYEKARAVVARRPELAPALGTFALLAAPGGSAAAELPPDGTGAVSPPGAVGGAPAVSARFFNDLSQSRMLPFSAAMRFLAAAMTDVGEARWRLLLEKSDGVNAASADAVAEFCRHCPERPTKPGPVPQEVVTRFSRVIDTMVSEGLYLAALLPLVSRAGVVLALGTRSEAASAIRCCRDYARTHAERDSFRQADREVRFLLGRVIREFERMYGSEP